MVLIYTVNRFGLNPITVAATTKVAKEYIEENKNKYEDSLNYKKINYVW